MATLFLENFSKSSVAASVVMQDFLVGCYGTAAELKTSSTTATISPHPYTVGPPSHDGQFRRDLRVSQPGPGDACSNSAVKWTSIKKANGKTGSVEGDRSGGRRVSECALVAVRQPVQREEQRWQYQLPAVAEPLRWGRLLRWRYQHVGDDESARKRDRCQHRGDPGRQAGLDALIQQHRQAAVADTAGHQQQHARHQRHHAGPNLRRSNRLLTIRPSASPSTPR